MSSQQQPNLQCDKFSDNLKEGFDSVFQRTSGSITALNKLGAFLLQISEAHSLFEKSLTADCTKFSKFLPIFDYSTRNAVSGMIEAIKTLTKPHSATSIASAAGYRQIRELCKDLDQRRRKFLNDYNAAVRTVDLQQENLKKTKQTYLKKGSAFGIAQANLAKREMDPTVKATTLADLTTKVAQAQETAQIAETKYKDALLAFNTRKEEHFYQEQTAILRELQALEEDTLGHIGSTIKKHGTLLTDAGLSAAWTSCPELIEKAFNTLDIQGDISAFVETNKTGIDTVIPLNFEPHDSLSSTPSSIPPLTLLSQVPVDCSDEEKGARLLKIAEEFDERIVNLKKQHSAVEFMKSCERDPKQQKLIAQELSRLSSSIQDLTVESAKISEKLKTLPLPDIPPPEMPPPLKQLTPEQAAIAASIPPPDIPPPGQGDFYPFPLENMCVLDPDETFPPENMSHAHAIFDFVGEAGQLELTFTAGEVIDVIASHPSGWWRGKRQNHEAQGLFPVNFVSLGVLSHEAVFQPAEIQPEFPAEISQEVGTENTKESSKRTFRLSNKIPSPPDDNDIQEDAKEDVKKIQDDSKEEKKDIPENDKLEDINEDLKEDLNHIKKDTKEDVKEDVKEDTKEDTKEDVKEDVKGDVKEAKEDVEGDVKEEVQANVKETVEDIQESAKEDIEAVKDYLLDK